MHVKIQKIHGDATRAIPAGRSHDGTDDAGREMNITRKTPPVTKRTKRKQVMMQTHAWPDLGLPSDVCCDITNELRRCGGPLFIKYVFFSSSLFTLDSLMKCDSSQSFFLLFLFVTIISVFLFFVLC